VDVERWMINCTIPLILIGIHTMGHYGWRYLPRLQREIFWGYLSDNGTKVSKKKTQTNAPQSSLSYGDHIGFFIAKHCTEAPPKILEIPTLCLDTIEQGKRWFL